MIELVQCPKCGYTITEEEHLLLIADPTCKCAKSKVSEFIPLVWIEDEEDRQGEEWKGTE